MAATVTQVGRNQTKTVYEQTRSKNMEPSKDEWIQFYARQIHILWLRWETPLGIADTYTKQVKNDLAEFYDDPLKRTFIEATYC